MLGSISAILGLNYKMMLTMLKLYFRSIDIPIIRDLYLALNILQNFNHELKF